MSTLLTLLLVLVIVIGFLLSIILFIIGIIRALLKKGWRLVIVSVVLFVVVMIFYSIARVFYANLLRPTNIANLQKMSLSPNSNTITSVCYTDKGNVTQQLNQAADNSREYDAEQLGLALKNYYIQYNKAPSTLDDLVRTKIMKSIPLDPVTKDKPIYMIDPDTNPSTTRICVATFDLCSGKSVFAYCK